GDDLGDHLVGEPVLAGAFPHGDAGGGPASECRHPADGAWLAFEERCEAVRGVEAFAAPAVDGAGGVHALACSSSSSAARSSSRGTSRMRAMALSSLKPGWV